jgi:hypothetical protein
VWQDLSDAIESMLDSITLEDLVARQGGRNPTRGRSKRGKTPDRKKVAYERCARNRARGLQDKDGRSARSAVASRGQRKKVTER